MRQGHYSIGKRLMALVLCICMVAAWIPNFSVPVSAITMDDVTNKLVDAYTINGWQKYFGPDVLSTEYAGGVWTDKSAFQSFAAYQAALNVTNFVGPNGSAVTNAVKEMLKTDPANFLLALSAISVNKSVSGSSSTPMDTMFVLDVSGSIQGNNAVAMVQATNRAIETLLKQNPNNRVGVVLYSGNHDYDDSDPNTASVLLPLGSYTTTNTQTIRENGQNKQIPAYLTISGSGNNQTIYVASSVNNGSAPDSKVVRGGTYIQNGLYQAWLQFNGVTDTKVPEGNVQAGVQRTPILVLMSDGNPTSATTDYNNVGTSNQGDGGDTSNQIGFLTQLTASWVRGKMKAKYGAEPKFYTLGFGTGSQTIATSVLNPAGSTSTLNTYWNNYFNNTVNGSGDVQIVSGRNGWSVYKDAAVTTKNYVDQYWLTSNSTDMLAAFAQIVQTIVLQSEQYSTLVEAAGKDLSGYVTFEEELGELMEIVAIKGLVMGDKIFTGAELAKSFTIDLMGTVDKPSAYGDEFVRTIKERLGITDTSVAQQLIGHAYQAGQLRYTSATEYSNYIGWYADKDGKYLGFWQESDGYGPEAAPKDAVYINKSYGYLGAQSTEDGASDMMHVVVMVHTEIATGHQSMVYKIPASLLPTVTYNVELNGEDPNSVKNITREEAFPLQLVFEVGLRSDINAVNLEAKVAEHLKNGGHIHKNQDGTYTFYATRWGDGDGGSVNYDEPLTHIVTESHFHPAKNNNRYYFIEDTLVTTNQSGTAYTGTNQPSGTMYHPYTYYEETNGTAKVTTKYLPVAEVTLLKAEKGNDGKWYIPAGTPRQETERFRVQKTEADNQTKTLTYSNYPLVVHDAEGYNTYAFLGNNASITIEPAQGIALSKTVTETVAGAPTEFNFTVNLSQAVAEPSITDADGNALDDIAEVNGRTISVKVKAGQTVYITGIPSGVSYTVEEETTAYYTATSVNATGVITAYTITPVSFTNVPRLFNDLIVSKDVLPPSWMTDISALEAQNFSIQVTITGADPGTTYTTSQAGIVFVTDAQGKASQVITLKDAQAITVYDLPVGTAYTVAEVNVPNGHTASATESAPITGVIPVDQDAIAGVTNTYAPAPAQTTITVSGGKTFLTASGTPVNDADWPDEGFTVELYSVDQATGAQTLVKGDIQVTAANKTWAAKVDLPFEKTGVYVYKIVEKTGTQTDIAYDKTEGLFQIIVKDDASGTLKVSQVLPVQDTATITPNTDGYTVGKGFTNYLDAGSVSIPVQKIVSGSTAFPANDFIFGLYDSQGALVSTIVGNGSFTISGYGSEFATAKNYTIREIIPELADRIPGMTYDSTVYDVSVRWDDSANGLVATVEGAANNTAVFTNTYAEAVTPAIGFSGTKYMTGDRTAFLTGESYTIELHKTGANFVTSASTLVTTDTVSGSDYDYAFGDLQFKQEGVYYYVIKEAAGNQPGVTYDTTEYHVTIHVTKAVEGNTTILKTNTSIVKYGTTETVAADALDFTNKYTISNPGQTVISGHKDLEGRELIAGEFEFGLYEGSVLLQSARNLTNGNFAFQPIHYTAADIGTHVYTVKEIANGLGGVSYDVNTVYTVTVTVSDNNQGGLTVTQTVSGQDGKILFTNFYRAEGTSATISGTKTWYNWDKDSYIALQGGEFTFELYESDAQFSTQGKLVIEDDNDASGEFSMKLDYLAPGNYYYILREYIGEEQGVLYDAGRYFIRVQIVDDGKGQLRSSVYVTKEGVGAVDAVEFGNFYKPESVNVTISGTKELTGRDLVNGEFTFDLYDSEGNLVYSTNNIDKIFTFPELAFEKSGIYTYTVKERIPEQAQNNIYKGVTYDATIYKVSVEVTDEDGVLTAVVSHTTQELVFRNTYQGKNTSFSLDGKKDFNKSQTDRMFSFDLYDENNVHVGTAFSDANGNFSFPFIPLTEAGTFVFYLSETVPAEAVNNRLNGITYSSDVYKIQITVTDNTVTGLLEAGAPVVTKNNAPVSQILFQNTYTVDPVYVVLRVNKALEGRDLREGEFSFRLTDGKNVNLQASNSASGVVTFDQIRYTEAGIYTYKVTEIIGNRYGITYDPTEYEIRVEVIDTGLGTLRTQITYPKGFPAFVNTYEVLGDTSFSLEGEKKLSGRDMTAEDVFTFELKDAAGNVIATAQNQGSKFRFENIPLTEPGRYVYTVTEKAPEGGSKDGVFYSIQVFTVTAVVADNGLGSLELRSLDISENGVDTTEMIFTNTYQVTEGTTADIEGVKSFQGGKELKENMFSFALYAGTDITAKPIAIVGNGADGKILFKNVQLNTLGKNIFTVRELLPENAVGGKLDGITYSTLIYTVEITTQDNGKGGMIAQAPVYKLGSEEQQDMCFINTYAVEGGTTVTIIGDKTLLGGKKLTEGMFTFLLYSGSEATGTPIAAVQNKADGSFVFENIPLNSLGEHVFTVKEQIPATADGITYDTRTYTVTVNVTDNGKGGMIASEPVYKLGADLVKMASFTNTYTPENVTVELTVKKIMQIISGASNIGPEGFQFRITDETGKELLVLVSDQEGNAAYKITLTPENIGQTFGFEITEIDTGKTGVTYSTEKYAVQVTLSQNDEGQLIPTIQVDGNTVEKAEAVFTNTYEAPKVPVMGDSFRAGLFLFMMAISSLGIAALVVAKKKTSAK